MKKQETYIGDPVRGLFNLVSSKTSLQPGHWDAFSPHATRHPSHPLGIDAPPPEPTHRRREFVFTGCGSRGQSSDAFLAAIRFWASFEDGLRVKGLRVIEMPFTDEDPDHHHVFFEVQIGNMSFISGEVTDFPEGTRDQMVKMEDVFALLAQTYRLTIERISIGPVSLDELYDENVIA